MTTFSLTAWVQKWVRPSVRALSAYHVPDREQFIKLDAMENPYHWESAIIAEWLEHLRVVAINRYPDAAARETKSLLCQVMRVPKGITAVLGNGSDELIQMLLLAVGGEGRTVLSVEPSFVMYKLLAAVTGTNYLGISLKAADFSLDLPALLHAIETRQPALIFLSYPNNPTGNLFDRAALETVIKAAPGIVVIDEAYSAFTDFSFMSDLGKYPNLLVMRTVSKIGLAGLRLGMLAGPPEWLNEVEKIRLPYNINVLTQVSANFALRHYAMLARQTEQIRADRQELEKALQALPAVQVWHSEANFILLRLPCAPTVFQGLKERGVLVKNLHGSHPLLENCLRVSIGTAAENQVFLVVLRTLL